MEKALTPYQKKRQRTTSKKTQKMPSETPNTTTLKQKELMDLETGEMINTLQIENKGKDINFNKIFIGHIIEAVEAIGNKKVEVLMYLFSVKNSDNQIIKTQAEMEKETKISRKTISDTLKVLREHNVIKKKSSSVYQLNPNAIFKGQGKKRMDILLSYEEIEDTLPEKKEVKINDNPETHLEI